MRVLALIRCAPLACAGFLACAVVGQGEESPARRAARHLAEGDTLAALRALEHVDLDAETGPDLYLLLGRLYRDRHTIDGRLRSQIVLERARRRFRHDSGVLVELGKTYFAQRFYPDAVLCFRSALAIRPDLCEPKRFIGLYHYQNWKRMNEYTDDVADAQRYLREAIDCSSTDPDDALKYLYAGYVLGDTSSFAECERMLARFPTRGEFYLYRGTLAFERARYEACADDFQRGIALLDEDSRRAYGDLGHVLPIADRDRYDASSLPSRDAMTRVHWLEADPDPTTPINERHLQHVYRMFLADALYSCGRIGKRGWQTDRGEAFVKFGPPVDISYSLGDDWTGGKVETWWYQADDGLRRFVFVDEFLNGNPRIPYEADLTLSFMRHSGESTRLTPVAVPLPGEMDVVAFKDDDLSCSVYVSLCVDADSLRRAVNLETVDHFVVRGAFFDEAWENKGRFADTLWTSEVPERVARQRRVYELVRRVAAPFDRYHLACAFEDEHGAARAQFKTDGDARRLLGDGLVASDILLYRDDGPAESAFQRGDRRMWSNIGHRYAAGERLSAYVEIYNLAVSGGASDYDLRYAIYASRESGPPPWRAWGRRVAEFVGLAPNRPTAIAQTFRRRGSAHVEKEAIAIDIGSLAAGHYELVVEVEDRRTGRRALSHTTFYKDATSSKAATM